MRSQTYLFRLVVCVGNPPAHMVLWDSEVIEAFLDLDEWREVSEHLEPFLWKVQI